MTGEARQPISRSEVKEYSTMPSNAEEIAIITVSLYSHYGGAEAKGQVRKKAASLGANGFQILSKQGSGGGFDAFGKPTAGSFKVNAKLFYVPK